jgi:hypothetical protein
VAADDAAVTTREVERDRRLAARIPLVGDRAARVVRAGVDAAGDDRARGVEDLLAGSRLARASCVGTEAARPDAEGAIDDREWVSDEVPAERRSCLEEGLFFGEA